jgi:hypothetical protein
MEKLRMDGHCPHSRTLERMFIIAQILSICLGLECLFNIPTAPYYGQPFSISQLKDIKPFLAAPQEVLHFICGLFAEQLVNPIESNILETIKSMHENNKNTHRFREILLAAQVPPPNYFFNKSV